MQAVIGCVEHMSIWGRSSGMLRRVSARPVLLAVVICTWLAANSVSGSESFGNVTIIAGFSPGGGDEGGGPGGRNAASRLQPQPGYDQTARLFARHIGAFLPGNPSTAVRHMPGAGSIKAAAFIANGAARDGSILGVVSAAALLAPLLGTGDGSYALDSFSFIGGRNADEYVCAAAGVSGVESFEDWPAGEMAFGVSAPGRRPYVHAHLLKQLAAGPIRIVSGYRDTNEMMLALRRGEVAGICGLSFETLRAGLQGLLASGKVQPLMRLSPPWLEKLRAVPRAQDVARRRGMTPEFINALDFMALEGAIAWTLVAPALVSPERMALLRTAFEAMQRDRGYLREAARRNLDIETVGAARIEAAVADILKTPADTLAIVKNLNAAP